MPKTIPSSFVRRAAPSKGRPLSEELRQGIAVLHDEIEQTPLARAIVDATIKGESYAQLLAQSYHLHEHLEERLGLYESMERYFWPDMRRTDAIQRDLKHFRAPLEDPHPALTKLFHQLAQLESENPLSLLGALYVLEGSRMGSMILVGRLAVAFGTVPQMGVGLDYHFEGLADAPRRFVAFKRNVDQTLFTDTQRVLIVKAAQVTLAGLLDLYRSLPA